MIYFVDEDASAFGAWILELEIRGHDVYVLKNADRAFDVLFKRARDGQTQIDLVVIDVMLAVDPKQSRFNGERTDGFLETGLRLLEDLCQQNALFETRSILLTNTANPTTRREALKTSDRFGVPLWEKTAIFSPVNFADRIEARLSEIRSSS